MSHFSSMVVLQRAFLHEHFFFFTYLSYHTTNTQYIPHISKLLRLTSCAIKNHSGVKTCRVAETRAQQLPHFMSDFGHMKTSLFLTYVVVLRREGDTVTFLGLEITKTSRGFEVKNSTDLLESLLIFYGLKTRNRQPILVDVRQ